MSGTKSYSAKTYIGLFVLFTILLIALYYNALDYYWVWDDLHIVRTFSANEVLGSFYNTWDPDRVETPALRPLTVVFNHSRCYFLGEDLPLHKLFLIFLFSSYLVLLNHIGNRYFKLNLTVLIMSALLIIFYRYSCIFILDVKWGVRLFQYILFLLSLLFILRYIDNLKNTSLFLSLLFYAFFIFTREDGLGAFPSLLILAFVYYRFIKNQRWLTRYYVIYAASVILITIFYFILRKTFIAQAFLVKPMFGPKSGLLNIIMALIWSSNPFGNLYTDLINVSLYWLIFLGLFLFLSFWLFDRGYRYTVLIISICYFFGCSPTYMIIRPEDLFWPITLFCILLSLMLYKYSRTSRFGLSLSVIIYISLLGLAAVTNYAQQQCFHPFSIEQISREYDFLYGEYSHTTVPKRRINYLTKKFNSLGIEKDDFDYEGMLRNAKRARLLKPKEDAELFLPRFKSWTP